MKCQQIVSANPVVDIQGNADLICNSQNYVESELVLLQQRNSQSAVILLEIALQSDLFRNAMLQCSLKTDIPVR